MSIYIYNIGLRVGRENGNRGGYYGGIMEKNMETTVFRVGISRG